MIYKEALDNIIDAYYMRGLKKKNFTPMLKAMYDMLTEHERKNAIALEKRKQKRQQRSGL